MHILDSNILHAEQRWEITCKNLTLQFNSGNKNTSNMVVISADSTLQKQQCIHGLKHDVTIAPCSIVPIVLHEFHNCKGHQGIIHMFQAIRSSYW